MKNWKLASLLLLCGGFITVACASDDGEPDDGNVDATGGTAPGSGGSDPAGTGGGGGESSVKPEGCGEYSVATVTPGVVDDFEGRTGSTADLGMGGGGSMEWALLPTEDGRAGQWAHGHFLNAAADATITPLGQFEVKDGAIRLWCTAGSGANDAQCNTAWNVAAPWQQYAALETLLQPWAEAQLGCYDLSTFTGIKFKAMSATTDKVQLKFATAETAAADPESAYGWSYKGKVINLTSTMTEFTVPFSSIVMPDWAITDAAAKGATLTAQMNLQAVQSMAFIVRTAEAKTKAADGAEGEKLLPYNITIDDVVFY